MTYKSLIEVVESLQRQIRNAKIGRPFDMVEYHCCVGVLLERLPEVERGLELLIAEEERQRCHKAALADAMRNDRR